MLFPPVSFVIDTKLTVEQVSLELREHAQKDYRYEFVGRSADSFFIGYVRHDSFKISRATSFKSYSPPILDGLIRPTAFGSKVEIVLDYPKLHKWGAMLIILVSAISIARELYLAKGDYQLVPMLWVFSLVFFIGVIGGSFVYEVVTSRNELIRVLEGTLRQ
jgi:hypothetical protein